MKAVAALLALLLILTVAGAAIAALDVVGVRLIPSLVALSVRMEPYLGPVGLLSVALGLALAALEIHSERRERNRPWVIVEFPVTARDAVHCVVRNIGQGMARDVSVRFEPEPIDFRDRKLSELSLFERPTPALRPGEELRQFFRRRGTLFGEDMPRRFEAVVSYRAEGRRRRWTDRFSFDLDRIRDLTPPVPTVEERLEGIERQLEGIVSALKAGSRDDTPVHPAAG